MSINSKRRRDLKKAKRRPASGGGSGGGSGLQPHALYQLNRLRKAYIKSWASTPKAIWRRVTTPGWPNA